MLEIANNRVPVSGHWPLGKWRAWRKWASGMKVEAKGKGQRAKGKGGGDKIKVSYRCYGVSQEQDSLSETI